VAQLREVVRKLTKSGSKAQRASAVAMRERPAGGVEFLLVRTSSGDRWTFPKGRRERGETLSEAAAREALEEAGVRGRAEPEPFAHYRYPSSARHGDLVAAFRFEVTREGLGAERDRDPAWYGLEAARSRLASGRDQGFGEEMERLLLAAQAQMRSDA
jgi:8-oxo-dGTP pyrophosphatase MutT (NUDIX family)